MKITIFSLFPQWFDGPLGDSIIMRARENGLMDIDIVNFREYTEDRHGSVDDAPYGGGGGMVLRADILSRALDARIGPPDAEDRPHVLLMSPRGKTFDQDTALRFASFRSLAIVCGHYEAVDQRLIDSRIDEEVSLGDFVLTGGEIPSMAIVDAVARMIPGVLGNEVSAETESFMNGLLEAPHYTRPEEFEGRRVPEVLLSGNHKAISDWREEEALSLTREQRADLYEQQLLHPAQIRRMARRGRPVIVWRGSRKSPEKLLFASRAILDLGDWQQTALKVRSEKGLRDDVWFGEVKEVFGPSPEADRKKMTADVETCLSRLESDEKSGQNPIIFLRNLLRALEVKD